MTGQTMGVSIAMIIGLVAGAFSAAPAAYRAPHSSASAESRPLLVLNSDQFQGKWKQFKGDLKKQWEGFTDDGTERQSH